VKLGKAFGGRARMRFPNAQYRRRMPALRTRCNAPKPAP
jgi:hypothetical protein